MSDAGPEHALPPLAADAAWTFAAAARKRKGSGPISRLRGSLASCTDRAAHELSISAEGYIASDREYGKVPGDEDMLEHVPRPLAPRSLDMDPGHPATSGMLEIAAARDPPALFQRTGD